jgi:radical SAM protein with 4Fe4S-binding SPASM domain
MKVFYVTLTGGEPLLHKDIFSIINYASEKNLKVSLTTNGVVINRRVAKKLKDLDTWLIRVSLDGSIPKIHDNFRGVVGSYIRTIKGIKALLAENLNVVVLTVVSKHNIHEVERIIDVVRRLGVKAINTYIFVPGGRGKNVENLALTSSEYKKFLERIISLKEKYKEIQILTKAPLMSLLYNSEISGACAAGTSNLFIEENGDVIPCPYLPLVIGNTRKTRLDYMWKNSKILYELRDPNKLSNTCKECEYVKRCFGGCRAAAYHKYGSISYPDPNCWIVNSHVP